jgi:ABC-type Na+ transport system ATPase subunit NatA
VPIRKDTIAYKRRLGYVPEEPHLYSHLSSLEFLNMVAQLRDLPRKVSAGRIDGLLRLFSLHPDRHALISSYSKGMRQKVLLSAALLHNPDLLLLDEPFSGLDVASALVLRSLIQELAVRGKVILFSSHELETVERVCSHVVILHRGKLVADDSIDHLRTLTALPTLEGNLCRTGRRAGYRGNLATDRRPNSGLEHMPKHQFSVLYREFLFRLVDRDLLSVSAQGDASRLLGRLAALLIVLSIPFALPIIGLGNSQLSHDELLITTWGPEFALIATTMLIVGLFSVLSWNSNYPERRDVLVLGPLPVRASTIFFLNLQP